jgi:hypothetical protein
MTLDASAGTTVTYTLYKKMAHVWDCRILGKHNNQKLSFSKHNSINNKKRGDGRNTAVPVL